MKFDFTGVADTGYTVLSPGKYPFETGKWFVTKKPSGHLSYRIMLKVLEGEYEGEEAAYFHTVMTSGPKEKIRTNKRFTLRLFGVLGIIRPEDRADPSDPLNVELEYGDADESEQREVLSANVNGEERSVSGGKGIAVVIADENTQSGVKVDRLEPYNEKQTSPETSGKGKSKTTGKKSAKGDLPF